MAFRGFPAEAIDFYDRLGADNSRAFWTANKATFEEAVRAPMLALCEELAEFGPFHLYRPHNDLRFARDRPPYKVHQGASSESEDGPGYYVQLSASGVMCGAGSYAMAADQLERFRHAVDDADTGEEVAEICAELVRRGNQIGAVGELKTAPRGYPRDHPRVDLLRRKGLMTWKEFGAPRWIHTARVVREVRERWAMAADLCAWLGSNVGPSTLPPDDFMR